VVADLSFISLTTVIGALAAVASATAHFLLMVKPQFEVGKEALPAGGVVREPADRAGAVTGVVGAAERLGLYLHHVVRSPLPGPSGNVEFFVHLTRGRDGALTGDAARDAIVRETGIDAEVAA
jgi:23S rRNA (cytidine1920-2'-O)/16S rRNA (cytidine1409-2'-O)-methyltransferase